MWVCICVSFVCLSPLICSDRETLIIFVLVNNGIIDSHLLTFHERQIKHDPFHGTPQESTTSQLLNAISFVLCCTLYAKAQRRHVRISATTVCKTQNTGSMSFSYEFDTSSPKTVRLGTLKRKLLFVNACGIQTSLRPR